MKKEMSCAEQIRLLNTVGGVAWIVVGVSNCFENTAFLIVRILGLLVCIASIVRVSVAQKENADEMAEENLCKAKAKTLDTMHGLFCVIAIAAMFVLGRGAVALDWAKVIPAVFFIVLGVERLLVGVNFRKLEDA